jgi:hypothetical protein
VYEGTVKNSHYEMYTNSFRESHITQLHIVTASLSVTERIFLVMFSGKLDNEHHDTLPPIVALTGACCYSVKFNIVSQM